MWLGVCVVVTAPGKRTVVRVGHLGSAVAQSARWRFVTCWSPDGKAAGGCDVEAQLSSTDASGGNEEASVNASDIVKGSGTCAFFPI